MRKLAQYRRNKVSSRYVGMLRWIADGEVERWSPAEGFEQFYQVSSFGRVRSLSRIMEVEGRVPYLKKGRVLKQRKNELGYFCINMYGNKNKKTIKVHRLVAIAFCSGRHEALVVDHANGNARNNHHENLRWVSDSLNMMNIHKTKTKSGVAGVRFRKGLKNPWEARGTLNGKYTSIGHFQTMEMAIEARKNHIEKVFEEFKNENSQLLSA